MRFFSKSSLLLSSFVSLILFRFGFVLLVFRWLSSCSDRRRHHHHRLLGQHSERIGEFKKQDEQKTKRKKTSVFLPSFMPSIRQCGCNQSMMSCPYADTIDVVDGYWRRRRLRRRLRRRHWKSTYHQDKCARRLHYSEREWVIWCDGRRSEDPSVRSTVARQRKSPIQRNSVPIKNEQTQYDNEIQSPAVSTMPQRNW